MLLSLSPTTPSLCNQTQGTKSGHALRGGGCQLGSSSHLQVSPLSVLANEMTPDIFRKQKNTTV